MNSENTIGGSDFSSKETRLITESDTDTLVTKEPTDCDEIKAFELPMEALERAIKRAEAAQKPIRIFGMLAVMAALIILAVTMVKTLAR